MVTKKIPSSNRLNKSEAFTLCTGPKKQLVRQQTERAEWALRVVVSFFLDF